MKFGIRKPSFKKRVATRTSWKRVVRHNMGFKAPRGFGWFTNPKRAAYNRIYNRTTISADKVATLGLGLFAALFSSIFSPKSSSKSIGLGTSSVTNSSACPRCNSATVLRGGPRGQFYGCSSFPRCRGTREYS